MSVGAPDVGLRLFGLAGGSVLDDFDRADGDVAILHRRRGLAGRHRRVWAIDDLRVSLLTL